jgi:hypothetical protein
VTIRITATGVPELQRTLSLIGGIPAQVVDDMAAIAYQGMREGAGRHSPRPEGSGRLYRSLFRVGEGSKTQTAGHYLDDAPHAEHVIFGSRPHEIRPKKPGGLLAWRSRLGGPMIFARRVWHPGYIGDNYRDTALSDAFRRFPDFVTQRMGAL